MAATNPEITFKNICACTMTEMCPGDDRFQCTGTATGNAGYFCDSTTASTCTLTESGDFGVTPGSCADSDATDSAYCLYVPMALCWTTGAMDTVVTTDSCTSTAITGGAVTTEDIVACYITRTADFGVTAGTCDPNVAAAHTCAYVAGSYCSTTGVLDTVARPDGCTSTLVATSSAAHAAVYCTLTGTTDLGVTPGSCAAGDSSIATCTYTAGDYTGGVEVTADTCTSVLVATETRLDTVQCTLTESTDFGVTAGSCVAVDDTVATCAYTPGAYSVGTAPDALSTPDSCSLYTPPADATCTTGAFVDPTPTPTPVVVAPAPETSGAVTVAVAQAAVVALTLAAVFV